MHPSVKSVFPSFSTKLEGRVPWMYCDVLGLVTIGIGNLIDPEEAALHLPFVPVSYTHLTLPTILRV